MDKPINNFVTVNQDILDGLESQTKVTFPVYPSAHLTVSDEHFEKALEIIDQSGLPCIFCDGEKFIIPESYTNLIDNICTDYSGKVIARGQEKKSEFSTLAIAAKLDPYLIRIGDAIVGLDGDAADMIEIAKQNPVEAKKRWRELYLSSMNEH